MSMLNGSQANGSHSNGHDPDVLLVCDGCDGKGRHIDLWGWWRCGLCDGTGVLTRSFWLAYAKTFPDYIRHRMLANEPPVVEGGPPAPGVNAWNRVPGSGPNPAGPTPAGRSSPISQDNKLPA